MVLRHRELQIHVLISLLSKFDILILLLVVTPNSKYVNKYEAANVQQQPILKKKILCNFYSLSMSSTFAYIFKIKSRILLPSHYIVSYRLKQIDLERLRFLEKI